MASRRRRCIGLPTRSSVRASMCSRRRTRCRGRVSIAAAGVRGPVSGAGRARRCVCRRRFVTASCSASAVNGGCLMLRFIGTRVGGLLGVAVMGCVSRVRRRSGGFTVRAGRCRVWGAVCRVFRSRRTGTGAATRGCVLAVIRRLGGPSSGADEPRRCASSGRRARAPS